VSSFLTASGKSVSPNTLLASVPPSYAVTTIIAAATSMSSAEDSLKWAEKACVNFSHLSFCSTRLSLLFCNFCRFFHHCCTACWIG
jgi:hypothetical protein